MVQQAKSSRSGEGLQFGPVRRFGRYTLIKKLATGGMAEIWLAKQSGLAGFNRFVVIKKILSHLAEEDTFVKMFLDEARMSVQLTHPNIVQVYDLGEADTTYFIAMEYIAGENLAAIAWRGVKRKVPLSPAFAARVIADACKGLYYAHHLKASDGLPLELVHRDISPQNLLVTYEGEVKLVDFGIAKAATKSQHTKTGMLKGKFSYMSPEQCLGHPVDMRSDIFALGIVLYELCTGKRLFKHASELMILEMITKRRITPPSDVAPNITPQLEAIIMKALQKKAEDRFQTGQDFQIALEDFLRSEGGSATNADIAVYMRRLFKDKIEEKQALCEMASAEDFGVSFNDEEPTEQAVPDRRRGPTANGRMTPHPSQARGGYPGHPSQRSMPGQMGRPGMTPNGAMIPQSRSGMGQYPPHPSQSQFQYGYPGMQGFQSASASLPLGPAQEPKSWVPWVVLGVALLVIGLAMAFLYNELVVPPATDPITRQVPNKPVKTGKLKVDSIPQGATILVDGKPVKLENGDSAKTPVEALTYLQYDMEYTIRLKLDGYQDYTRRVRMGPEADGSSIAAKLEPIKGSVTIEITGTNARDVRVFINDQDKGSGDLEKTHLVVPGKYRISGILGGHSCTKESVTVRANSKKRVTIRCSSNGGSRVASRGSTRSSAKVGRSTGTRRSGGGRRTRADKPPPSAGATGPAGCRTLGGGLFGHVTINTNPYSIVSAMGRKLGETPLPKVKLPAGCVELVAVHPPTGKSKKVRIKVEPNKTSRYMFKILE